jgi:AcrR family transcriptional regulator
MYKNYLKRKEKVIISSVELLDEAGIKGLTTKELAKREGITEPAIYRQFDSKKDIILALIDKFSEYDEFVINTIKEQKMSYIDSIYYFAEIYALYYQNYPQITTIIFSFDAFKYEKDTLNKMKDIINKRYEFIREIIENGQKYNQISKDIDSKDLADMILGMLWSLTYTWKLDDSKGDLKEKVMKSLKWILKRE